MLFNLNQKCLLIRKWFTLLAIVLVLVLINCNAQAQCTSCTINITTNSNQTITTANSIVCITGTFTYNRTINLNANNITLCIGSGVTFSSSAAINFNGTNPIVNNYGIWQEGGISITSGRVFNNYGVWSGGITMNGGIFNNEPLSTFNGTVSYGTGTYNNEGSFTFASDITLPNGFTFNNYATGTVLNSSGNSVVMSSGSVLDITGGNFAIGNDLTANSGSMLSIGSGATLAVTDNVTIGGGTANNSGTLTCDNLYVNSGTLTNSGSITAANSSDVTGTLNSTGTLNFNSSFAVRSGANMSTTNGAIIGGNFTNSGTLYAGGTWSVSGSITNNSGATLNGTKNINNTCSSICGSSFSNNGSIGNDNTAGSIVLCRTVTSGTIGSKAVNPPSTASPTNLLLNHLGNGLVSGSFTAAPTTAPAPQGYVVLRRLGNAVDVTNSDINGSVVLGQSIKNSKVVALLTSISVNSFVDNLASDNASCGAVHYAVFPTNNFNGNTNGCIAVNNLSTPALANLTVNYLGGVNKTVGPDITCSGSTSNYTVSSTNATSYLWLLTPLSAGTVSGTGANRTISWSPSFAGQATVTVTANGCGTLRVGVFQVDVVSSTNITSQPLSTLNVCNGNATTISVSAFGPSINYQWQLKAPVGVWTNVSNTGVYSNATSPALNISNVNGLDGFEYRCQVSSSCGNLTSNTSTLSVKNSGTWIGGISSDWNNSSNWCGGVPSTSGGNIILDGSEDRPLEINSDITLGNVSLLGNGNLIVKANRILNITGNLTSASLNGINLGILTCETGSTIRFSGGNQIISAGGTYHNIEFAGTGLKTISSNLIINNGITLTGTATIAGNSGQFTLPISAIVPTGTYGSLSFLGAGIPAINGNATVINSLTLNQNQTLDINGFRLTLNGTVTGKITTSKINSRLRLGGSINQVLDFATSITPLDSLIIQKSGGSTTLASNTNIVNVRLLSGSLSTGLNTLTITSNGSLNETATAVVIGRVNTQRTLLTGVNNNLGNLGLSILAQGAAPGVTTLTRFTGETYAGYAGNQSIARKYAISPTVNTGLNATLVFTYNDNELGSLNEQDLVLFRSTNGGINWDGGRYVPSVRDMVNNTLTVTGINAFSDWTAADQDLPLPITLINFSVGLQGTEVIANWQTSSEKNLSHFELEYSRNGLGNFNSLGKIEPSNALFEGIRSYKFKITDPHFGGYYRLASFDNDGKIQYSAQVKLTQGFEGDFAWGLFPNPCQDYSQIQINAHSNGLLKLSVFEPTGKVVNSFEKQLNQGSHIIRIETEKLSKGIYFIKPNWNGIDLEGKKLAVK